MITRVYCSEGLDWNISACLRFIHPNYPIHFREKYNAVYGFRKQDISLERTDKTNGEFLHHLLDSVRNSLCVPLTQRWVPGSGPSQLLAGARLVHPVDPF